MNALNPRAPYSYPLELKNHRKKNTNHTSMIFPSLDAQNVQDFPSHDDTGGYGIICQEPGRHGQDKWHQL